MYQPYSSIDNFRPKNLECFFGKSVVFTEKIHGSNLQFYVDIDEKNTISLRHGKRSGFIYPKENFFQSHKLVEKYKDRLEKMIINEKKNNNSIQIRLIGEYYGGIYRNHSSSNSVKIQKGNYANYRIDNDFIVFDIVIDNRWLTWDQLKIFCDNHQLTHVPEVCRGIWEDVSKNFNVETFNSIVSRNINGEDNPAEGIVIRLIDPFTERNDDHRDHRVKWKCTGMMDRVKSNLSNSPNFSLEKYNYILSMMNQPRFDSYLSKVGPEYIIHKNFGVNIKALVDDVVKDYMSEFPNTIKKDIKPAFGQLSKNAKNYIMTYMRDN